MTYTENPKTKGSGVICCIPQCGTCPVGCADCFFQSGRSYLEPLDQNLPNIPPDDLARGRVVRMNDGNDSNVQRELVMATAARFEDAFFNTSMPRGLAGFGRPVVLTVNPAAMTDRRAHLVDPAPPNLMFVRFRANLWNQELGESVVAHYTSRGVPVVYTFMAYFDEAVAEDYRWGYAFGQRTTNEYWIITPEARNRVMAPHTDNPLVSVCCESEKRKTCRHCGICLREYYACKVRMGR